MRVAYHSPLPPSRSGIADYSALLMPALERHVQLVVPGGGRGREPRSDVALYHVGNDPSAHSGVIEALRRRPGVVVLHEFVLHHLVAGMTLAHGDREGYVSAVEREAGLVGRLLAHAAVDHRILPLWESRPRDFPLAFWALDSATGVIVHSRHVETLVREAGYELPLWRIPHPAWPLPEIEPARLDAPGPLVGCFGHLNESKRVPELLAAFARLRASHPQARLLVVGSTSLGLSRLRFGEGVIREQYVPEPRLWSLMAACDVIVGLRAPTMGETSGSAIRALCLGKPQVVSDLGWFAELPDEVALKVAPGPGEVEALELALAALVEDEPRRSAMGAAAAALARNQHAVERVARLYAEALAEAVARGGEPVDAGSRA